MKADDAFDIIMGLEAKEDEKDWKRINKDRS